jgi:tetratricopeptide (TPR) repeat protein
VFKWFKNIVPGVAQAEHAAIIDRGAAQRNRGNEFLDRGDFEQAADCYRQAIAIAPDDLNAHINLGFALSELQRHTEAQAVLRRALELDPQSVDALYMLATMAQGAGNWADAVERFDQVLAIKPDFEMAYRGLSLALSRQGRIERAREVIRQGIEHFPRAADFHFFLGNLHAQKHELEEAIRCYGQAAALAPDYAEAHFNLAGALQLEQRLEPALASYRNAIAARPDYAEALFECGNLLTRLKRYEEALASYDALLTFQPGRADVQCNRGRALQGLERHEEALAAYDRALQVEPASPDALFNRGSVLEHMGRHEDALAAYDRLLQLQADHEDALCNRGNTLRSLNRIEAAIASYDRALQLSPSADVFNNRGAALADLNRYQEALASYGSALQLQPEHPGAHLNRSLCRLLLGDFEQGWPEYEWRWKNGDAPAAQRHFPQPQWSGAEPLHGKTILLHAEQGLGDTIQFARYAELLAQRGASVLLEVQPALQTLLADLNGVGRVLVKGQPLPAFDLHCPLLSLPLAFKTDAGSIPAPASYLTADPQRVAAWSARLGPKLQPRVGLVWSGSTIHKNDRNRSIRLDEFRKLMVDGVQFVSLQKELRAEDVQALSDSAIAHVGDRLGDFSETAGLVAQMDLVISVDTSVAHLAAAMGKPVWLLLSANPDWRWMLQRRDTPWYPSMTLFRQPRTGEWGETISAVARELAAWRLATGTTAGPG